MSLVDFFGGGKFRTLDSQGLICGLDLDDEKRSFLCEYVRHFLEHQERGVSERYDVILRRMFPDVEAPVSLGVSLWVEGRFRGCRVVRNQPLKQALMDAARHAAWDLRFKPVSPSDIQKTRIEICVFSSSNSMTAHRWKQLREIDPKKAYRLYIGNRSGVFLPEIFNCSHLSRTPQDFLEYLAKEKQLDGMFLSYGWLEISDVDDFMESVSGERTLRLSGPLVQRDTTYEDFDASFYRDLEGMLHRAACHLMYIQEQDGNFPARIDPLSGWKMQVDWVRLALTVHALGLFGEITNTEAYLVSAEKARRYLEEFGYNHPYLDVRARISCRVYEAEYYLARMETDKAECIAREISVRSEIMHLDLIPSLKVAVLLASFQEKAFLSIATKLFESIWSAWKKSLTKKKARISLALFPEFVVVAEKLFEMTGNQEYRQRAREMAEWFIGQQSSDGSFPAVHGGMFAYTRGTGKIFEVLALRPQDYRESILRAYSWLRTMQYTEENTYFVREEYKGMILGGFRHDVFNHAVWIDSVAHVLIGGVRLLQHSRQISKKRNFG